LGLDTIYLTFYDNNYIWLGFSHVENMG
jgi:hypothetical protein